MKKFLVILALMIISFLCYQKNNEKRFFLDAPIAFDFARNGIDLIDIKNSNVFFDIDSNGTKEKVSWISAGSHNPTKKGDITALIVIDKNSNNNIDNADEFFGKKDKNKTSREELAEYDQNQDGYLDEKDPIFSQLKIWIDINNDGISSANEIAIPLSKMVSQINCRKGININRKKNGSIVKQEGYVIFKGLSPTKYYQSITSVEFEVDKTQTPPKEIIDNSASSENFIKSPLLSMNFLGLGTLIDAMNKDNELYNQVKAFETLDLNEYAKVDNMVENILYRWSGAEAKLPNGSSDEKKLATMEVIFGRKLDPSQLNEYWPSHFSIFREKILAQITFSSTIFLGAKYDPIMYGKLSFDGISYQEILTRISNFYQNTQNKAAANYFVNIFKSIIKYNPWMANSAKTLSQDLSI